MSDVKLPAHLSEVLDTMSQEMGVPRDALVSQAVFQFARLSGYIVAGTPRGNGAAAPAGATAPVKSARPATAAAQQRGNRRAVPPDRGKGDHTLVDMASGHPAPPPR